MATTTARTASSADAYEALLDDLVAEAAALRRLVAPLPEAAWAQETVAARWTIRHQIAHLAYFDEAATLAASDPLAFRAAADELTGRADDFADVAAAEHADRPGAELLAWWDRAHAGLVRTLRRLDPRARLAWYGPDMSAMSAATARLMETWAHGVDVTDTLGFDPEASPRLRHVAHLGVATRTWSLTEHGYDPPSAPVRVELSGPGGVEFLEGPDDAPDSVRGPLLDFCLVVTQRRHVEQTALEVRGEGATTWMAVAQTYAGKPTRRHRGGRGAGPGSARRGTPAAEDAIHRVNVGDLLARSARRRPDAIAVVDGERRLSYAVLDAWVNRLSHGLLARGYTRGDRLALVAGNCAEFLAVYFACARTGVVCVPVNLGWRPAEVTYVLSHSRARGLVAEASLLEGLAAPLAEAPDLAHVVVIDGASPTPGGLAGVGTCGPSPGSGADAHAQPGPLGARSGGRTPLGATRVTESLDALAEGQPEESPEVAVADRDPVTFLYTSGTTAAPKGVVGSHLAVYLETLSMALECRFGAEDRFVAMLPMFHTAQLNVHCTPAIAVGATIHVLRGFDAGQLLALVERERITQIFGLPMMYRAMLDHPDLPFRDLSSLRRATYAMAPMPEPDLRAAIERFDCDFCLLFGQTEMSPATTIFRPEHQLSHAGAVGTPVVNVEVAVVDAGGRRLPAGETGEIVYRGPHAMSGYLDDPDATADAFAGGWFHSGDAGVFDGDGILWFRDRFKDVIKTGGENVASLEVEQALLSGCADAAEVAVVGLPHARWSEAVTAFVVTRSGGEVDEEAVRAALRDRLDGFKLPKRVLGVDALPRTSTGKVRKNLLRERYRDLYEGER